MVLGANHVLGAMLGVPAQCPLSLPPCECPNDVKAPNSSAQICPIRIAVSGVPKRVLD
jgi:hypothetical protein